MLLPALGFCGGAASLLLLPGLPSPATLPILLLAAIACRRRAPLLAAALCGICWSAPLVSARLADDWPCARDREAVVLTGVVAAPAIARTGRTDFEFDAQSPRPLRVRLAWYDADLLPEPGQRWRLKARLRCRRGFLNAGAPDRELGLLRQGISATGYVLPDPAPIRIQGESGRGPIESLRNRVMLGIAGALPHGPSVAALQGLAVGVRGSIPDELWDAFAATGIAHLMAISGLHVTGCALFTLALLRLARRLPGMPRLPHWITLECALVVAVTAGYTWLSGASAPALRTLAMVAIAALLRLSRRHWGIDQALLLAALCLIGADPLVASSAGFWLSFVATGTLLAMAQRPAALAGRMKAFARAQIAVLVTLAPVLAAAFGRVSLVAPLANAVAIPLFGVVLLPAVLLGTALELAGWTAAAPVWRALAAVLDPLWPALLALARWPLADWSPAQQPGPLLALAGLAAVMALYLPLAGLRAAAMAMLAGILAGAPARGGTGDWSLTVVDVGQGLAAVVETRQRVLVFDSGPRWRGGGSAAQVTLLPYLRSRGIRRIDRLVVSHADQDHAGGVAAVLAAYPATPAPACVQGEHWTWDGVEFRVLHPPPGWEASDNDSSCALRVSSPSGRALLLADPERRAEEAMLAQPLAAEVVLLPHHGSRTSSGPALVTATGASLGIAAAGFGNRWGMPSPEVVGRWRAAGATVIPTAGAGAVTVSFGSRGRAVEVARGERRWWRSDTPL